MAKGCAWTMYVLSFHARDPIVSWHLPTATSSVSLTFSHGESLVGLKGLPPEFHCLELLSRVNKARLDAQTL